jgi:ABC-2 type transport system ATP-binding protein
VDGLDLRLDRGTSVALLGPNGAGKSTAIGMLLGLLEPDSGTVALLGTTPEQAVRAGRVGAMPQTGRLIGGVTVRELLGFVRLAYARKAKAIGRASTVPALSELMETARITELAGRKADRLSGGQAQRVRFAIAMAGAPDLVVLDEPTTGLDIEARRELWAAVRGYADRGGTVLFSTHYLEEADAHADRIVVIDRGRIVADGTGDQLRLAAGGSLVSFDLAGRGTEGLSLLPGVRSVEVRGDRARLRTTDSDATVIALAELGAIRGLQVAPASLDDAFMTLTAVEAA